MLKQDIITNMSRDQLLELVAGHATPRDICFSLFGLHHNRYVLQLKSRLYSENIDFSHFKVNSDKLKIKKSLTKEEVLSKFFVTFPKRKHGAMLRLYVKKFDLLAYEC